jgi:hypothetical protein
MKMIRFESKGLKTTDVNPKEVREALGIPEVVVRQAGYRSNKYWTRSARHQAVVNMETGQLYGIHSDKYHLTPHEEGVLESTRALEKNPEFGAIEWRVQNEFNNFGRVHLKGIIPDAQHEINKGDLVNPSIEYFNSYDGGWAEINRFGAYRVICSNGLTMRVEFLKESVRHFESQEKRKQMYINLSEALHGFSVQTELWRKWADRELSIGNLDSLESIGMNKAEKGEVVEETSKDPDMSLWVFYNLITAIITHKVRSLNRQVAMWDHLRRETNSWT